MPILTRNGRRVLQVHIPKTGGTSITLLADMLGWRVSRCRCTYPGYDSARIGRGERIPMQHATKYTYQNWQYDYAFAVVRNPLERAKSELAQWGIQPDQAYDWYRMRIDQHRSLRDGRSPEQIVMMESNRWPGLTGWHIWPQVDYVAPGVDVLYYGHEDPALQRILGKYNSRPKCRVAEVQKYELPEKLVGLLKEFYAQDFARFYPEVENVALLP